VITSAFLVSISELVFVFALWYPWRTGDRGQRRVDNSSFAVAKLERDAIEGVRDNEKTTFGDTEF